MTACQLRKDDVARDMNLFRSRRNSLEPEPGGHDALVHRTARRERQVFAMIGDRDAERSGILQRRAHQVTRHHRVAVIAHGDGARRSHLAELRQPFAALADRHAADRVHAGQRARPRPSP